MVWGTMCAVCCSELQQYGASSGIPPLWSQVLSQDKIRVESSARQMSNHTVKPCQANEGADNKAGNCVQCARGQDGTSWMLQTIVGDPEGFR